MNGHFVTNSAAAYSRICFDGVVTGQPSSGGAICFIEGVFEDFSFRFIFHHYLSIRRYRKKKRKK